MKYDRSGKKEPRTWTFEPDEDVKSVVRKAIHKKVGRKGNSRGLRTKLINQAVRIHFAYLAGKREIPTLEQ